MCHRERLWLEWFGPAGPPSNRAVGIWSRHNTLEPKTHHRYWHRIVSMSLQKMSVLPISTKISIEEDDDGETCNSGSTTLSLFKIFPDIETIMETGSFLLHLISIRYLKSFQILEKLIEFV